MREIIYQTDVTIAECTFIVLDDDTCIALGFDHDTNTFRVSTFDLLDEVPSWVDLDSVASYADIPAEIPTDKEGWIQLTQAVADYHGAIQFDSLPVDVPHDNIDIYIQELCS